MTFVFRTPRTLRAPRTRSAVFAGVLLATAVPMVATATAPHLSCAPKPVDNWETIQVDNFQPISGIAASDHDVVEAYSVDNQSPQNVAVTNGYSVLESHSHGCSWNRAYHFDATVSANQTFLGANARIVSVAQLGTRVIAAVQEGTGSASRPHIVVSDSAGGGTWTQSDNGLPAQGAPRLLRAANDGRTAYLTISPTATGGSDSGATTGILPLPGGGTTTPTGLLYRTTDGGANWTLQTGPSDIPGGGTGFSQLVVDHGNSDYVYGIVSGRLLTSRDAGGTFTAIAGSGYTAVTSGAANEVLAFSPAGGVHSFNGGATFQSFPAPAGVTSAGARAGSSGVFVELGGKVYNVEPATGEKSPVAVPRTVRAGSLLADRSTQSTYHALSGHALLRYVDPVAPGTRIPPLAVGDLTVPPPNPGVVTPRARNVSLPVGSSSIEDFTLDLPKNPTPLDLFFLVDVSTGMNQYVKILQDQIRNIVRRLAADRIDLRVGLGTLGTGPDKGERPYPDTYVFPPNPDGSLKLYVKPTLYNRLREVGETGASLEAALQRLKIETAPPGSNNSEGQMIALKNLATGHGTNSEEDEAAGLNRYSAVPPGQEAGWRGNPDVRRVVVMATNEMFAAPYGQKPWGTDELPGSGPNDVKIDFGPTLKILNDRRIKVMGLTTGATEALADLTKLAAGTHMVAPPGGVSCGGEPAQFIEAGSPLVCNNDINVPGAANQFGLLIERLLAGQVDQQTVQAVPHARTPVLGAIDAPGLRLLDVKRPNSVGFQVHVSCLDVKPGAYPADVDLVLRQTVVGRARVNVTCLKANALARPRPIVPPDPPVNPPPAAAPNPPPPPAPAPPAAQPQAQPQVQTQVQIQPLTAGAIQEQQELQLALALNGTLKDDDPAFSAGQQMAMVDRRKREEVQALGVLAFAVVACAGLGLAGLRARPEVRVRRAS